VIFFYADEIEPGKCARLRWDPAVEQRPTLAVYTTPQDVCTANNAILLTQDYTPWWRYVIYPNRTLKPVAPIEPDYNYTLLWWYLLNMLSQLYRNMQGNFTQRLSNATQTNSTVTLSSFGQMQFLNTIRMDAATSVWLRTTLNELQRWQVVAPAVGGAVSVSLQAPSALTASAAAAAVATAWAASRRSLATAAFLAGSPYLRLHCL